jgi:dimethylaniline monooxygenase (N-oxide forming)
VNKVSLGEIIPKGNIRSIHSASVTFIDGTKEDDIDTIIFATGYAGMSCMYEIPNSIRNGEYYQHLFLIEDPTVVRVGFIRPYLTSIPMMIEMQSKYVSKVFSKKVKLPNKTNMQTDYTNMKKKQEQEFSYDYERVQGIVDPYDYMNLIAEKIGAKPSFFDYATEWKVVLFGSWNPYYYMLNHPDPKKREIALQEFRELKKHPSSLLVQNYGIQTITYIFIFILFLVGIIIYLSHRFVTKSSLQKIKKYIKKRSIY